MTQAEVEALVASLGGVEREDNFGYAFFFVGSDHRLPFVTTAGSDNEYDNVSDLDRDGVFRVNIGVGGETFQSLAGESVPENVDYTALNVFMPHPDYAKQNFICILSPSGESEEPLKAAIREAHSIARTRRDRREGER